ncbi:transporter [archaeon SCG-AAA382B04]|nr:transporter [archaeon SCG-AAA382B04]
MIEEVSDLRRIGKGDGVKFVVGALIILLAFFLPTLGGLSRNGQLMIGVLLFAAFFWSTEPIPVEATSLLIMILPPLFGIITSSKVFSEFGNSAVFFLLGAFMLAAAIEKYGLHKRIALRMLDVFGYKPNIFLFGLFVVGGFLSFLMPEHAVAALLYPIVVNVLRTLELNPKESNFGIAAALSLTFGTSIGSWGTLLGGARNPLTIGILAQRGIEIDFLEWMIMTTPVVVVSLPVIWFIVIKLYPPEVEKEDMKSVRKDLHSQVEELGTLSRGGILTAFVFSSTVFLWIIFSSTLGVAVVSLMGAISLFFFGLVDWEDIEKRVPWGIMLLYGGALTLGVSLTKTGAANWLATNITGLAGGNNVLLVALLIVTGFLLTNSMSNTAAVAVLLPIGLEIAVSSGLNSVVTAFAIALSGGGALLLIISTPSAAIAYSTGYFSSRDLFKAGTFALVALVAIVLTMALTYWQFASGLIT